MILIDVAPVLERVHNFLPRMEAANAELLQRAQSNPESVDIEHLDDNRQGAYIEMVSPADMPSIDFRLYSAVQSELPASRLQLCLCSPILFVPGLASYLFLIRPSLLQVTDRPLYIQNLGLGVFDVRRPASEHTDSKSHSDSDIDVDVDGSDSDDDASDSVTDGEGDDAQLQDVYSTVIGSVLSAPSVSQRPMKPLPKRTRPAIQVLGESGPSDEPAHENTNPS